MCENKKNYTKMIFLDLDGTLLDDNKDLPKENIVAGFMSSGDFNGLTKEDLVMLFQEF